MRAFAVQLTISLSALLHNSLGNGAARLLHNSLGNGAARGEITRHGERGLSHILRPRSLQRCHVLQEYEGSVNNVNLASLCPWENELKSTQGQFYYEAKCLCEQPSSNYVIGDNIRCRKVYKSIKFQKLTCSNGCRVEFIEKQIAVACVAVFS